MNKRNTFIAGGVLLVIVLVSLLPVFLSSGLVQNLILGRVNNRISGMLSLGRCNIGWQQGLQCSSVSYEDVKQGIYVDVPRLNGTQGLLELIVAPKNLGTFSVDDPLVILSGHTTGVKKKSPAVAEQNNPPVSTPVAKEKTKLVAAASDAAPFWDKLNVKLKTNRMVVKLSHGNIPAETFIRNGSLDARLASGSVNFELSLESGDGEGTTTASGFVNLPARKGSLFDALVTEINLHVMDLQVEHFLTLIPDNFNFPMGRGKLTSELFIKATGTKNLQVIGTNMLRNVKLAGGFLGEDQPEFKQVNLDLDLQRDTDKGWKLQKIQLASDFGTLDLTGSLDGRDIMADGKGRLELPILFEELPHLLKMQPDTRLEDGSMNIFINLVQDQERLDVVAALVVENISGTHKERYFAWNSPINMDLDGRITGGEIQDGKVALKAPFLNLEGKGNSKAFSLQGTADLGQALQEVGKIFQLNWDAGGRLLLTAESNEGGENRYDIKARMNIADFSLSHNGKTVVPGHQFTISGRLNCPRRFPDNKAEAMDLSFDFSSWAGRMNGKLNNVYRKDRQISASYQLQSDLQLGRLTDMLHSFDVLNRETTLAGRMEIQASGYTDENRLVVRELDSKINDLIFYRQGKIYRDSSLRLFSINPVGGDDISKTVRAFDLADDEKSFFADGGGCNMFDVANHRIVLRDLRVTSDVADLNVSSLSVDDWKQFLATLSLKFDAKADLADLTPVLQQYGLLKSSQGIGGNGTFTVDMAVKNDQEHEGTVKLDIIHATAGLEEQILLDDELHCISRLHGNFSSGDIDVDSFKLQFAPLSLQAKGRLQRTGKEPYFSLHGVLTPDFTSLATLVNTLYATDIRAAGRQQEVFSLHYPLGMSVDEQYRKLHLDTGLHARYISHSGLDLQALAMPVSIENGVLLAALTGEVNNGALKFSPRLDFAVDDPVVTLPEAEQVLTDAHIELTLVDGVLKRINPVFGLLAHPTGTISARMNRFSWPLVVGAEQTVFSTVLNVSKVKLASVGVLREILDLVALADEPLTLKQSEITCDAAKGWISCTPLKILVADSEMTLRGSVGFDGSLDYLLEVPVTSKLVGKEGYRVLKGTTLKVPIRGNSDQAVFDHEALSQAISDLFAQAAGKAAGKVIEEQADTILPGLIDGLMGN